MKNRPHQNRRPAVALLLVLGMLAMLGVMVTQFVAGAEQRLTWEAQRAEQGLLRRNAFSALETSLSVLGAFQRIDGSLYGPGQGWGDPLTFAGFVPEGGVEVSVELRDESGFYGINSMDSFSLRRFFQDLGIAESRARDLSDCLQDWTDSNTTVRMNGAEEESYQNGIAPPNRALRSVSELRLIRGFSEIFFSGEGGEGNDLWRLLRGSVSLLGTASNPNINTAPREVLEVLATRYNFDPDSLIAARSGEANISGGSIVFRNAGDLGRNSFPAELGNAVSFTCANLRVIVRARKADASLTIDTLLSTTGGTQARNNQFPFTITQQRVNALLD